MESTESIRTNPLKRSFDDMDSKPQTETEAMDVDQHQSFIPRKYQMKVFEEAMKRNTIVSMETGAGKTLIAVMLIKEVAKSLKLSDDNKLIVFLAPTVHLVRQQCEVIRTHTELLVDEYYGAKGVDEWKVESWEKEIKEHDVLVMTPQILLDTLRKAFMSFEAICFMVIDECHHAAGNHPYAKIMEEFYHKSVKKPKLFGMTASLVNGKGVSSDSNCEEQFSELELLLDSRIYTIKDRNELEEFMPSARQICKFYDPTASSNLQLKEKLESSWSKFDAVLLELQSSQPSEYKDINDKSESLRKRLSNDHAKILCCLEDLGLICAYEAVKVCIENAPNMDEECDFQRNSSLQHINYLEEVSSVIRKSLPLDHEKLLDLGYDSEETKRMGHISAKLHQLLEIFKSFGNSEQVLCLIFVERIITAKVIERVTKKITHLSHFMISYLTGSNTSVDGLAPKMQKETLESFRSRKVNLLFTTDVIEEGIHVPDCSTVIRFDLPKTVRSYIQSRGRARQSNSQFVLMLERGNKKQRDQMFDIIRSEYSMAQTAINREPTTSFVKAHPKKETDAYYVEITGASVTVDSSVSLINTYCGKLPRDNYFTPKPDFKYLLVGDSYQCKLTLPPNAAFQTIVGPESRKPHLSKQLVCLEACKKLHQLGALNDHLLPSREESSSNESTHNKKASVSGAGTTKRKELHGSICISALSGCWGNKLDGFLFQAYKIVFACNIAEEHYSNFILLLEGKLDDDVGNVDVELFLIAKFVKSSVSHCGQVFMDAEQVAKAKCFHELFFNGLFGKLFIKSSGERQFLLQTKESLWDQSNMYLLLPLETQENPSNVSWAVNWTAIESCVSVAKFFKENAWLTAEKSEKTRESSFHDRKVLDDYESTNVVHLANKSVCRNDLEDMVVMAIHTGRIYSVVEAINNSSAESPFHENCDGIPSSYSSFSDYFKKKYRITLLFPRQPLLLLKQSHNAHNLLVDFKKEDTSNGKKPEGDSLAVPLNYVHMPPELLVGLDVRRDVLRAFYLLPSLMHRLESLMLASQLRKQIACHSGDLHISSSLILEALTTLRCNESFSMERLELLGDSVLKYAVSCHLFLKYPKKHEGQLSSQRSWAVCNSTLHKLGTDRKLQGYIRESAFDPRRWTAPGQRSIRVCPCEHGVDTWDVPLDSKFFTEDIKVVVGKLCDKGHRWMGSKTISDCVEALIGAYYVGGGLIAALRFMKWLGIDAEVEPSLVEQAIQSASLHSYTPKAKDIEILESKLGYTFTIKGLLLEAITHVTEEDQDVGYCYQRLEYLGDSVLDILITWHLYENHTDIDPGELTDLRSASVNNESFAIAAVRRNLHPHLQHSSGFLDGQISSFAQAVSDSCSNMESLQSTKCPKVLGDLVESIAGAILIDTKLDLDEVWRIFKPILSPIVTPDKLELPPLRELIELCDSLGYFVKEICKSKGEMVHAELKLQLKDALLVAEGLGQTRKTAKGQAAVRLLKQLEKRGISSSKKQKVEICTSSSLNKDAQICGEMNGGISESVSSKKQKITELHSKENKSHFKGSDSACKAGDSTKLDIPVIAPINTKKGGPRTSLFDLCKKLQWPMPTFQTTEQKSRSPIEFDVGSEKRTGFSSFVSQITLTIPDFGIMELTGDQRADKKSSFDSAALAMLNELERQGKLIITKS